MLYAKQYKQNGHLSSGSSRPSSSSLWSSMTNSHMSLNPPPMIAQHEIGSSNSATRDFESNLNDNLHGNVGIFPVHNPTAPFPMYNYGLARTDQHFQNQNTQNRPSMRGAEAIGISRDNKLVLPGRGKIVNHPRCAKCLNHGQFILLKNHKRYCAWKDCHCERCCRTNERKRAKATHEAKRRWKKVDEELGLAVPRHLKVHGRPEESPLRTDLLTLGSTKPKSTVMNWQSTTDQADHCGRECSVALPMNLLNELSEHPSMNPLIKADTMKF